MTKIIRYYIMPEIWETVTDSQVFGWLELLNKNGYPSNCISLVGWKNFINGKANKEAIRKKIGGRFFQIPIIPKILLSDLQFFIIFFFIWIKEVFIVKKIIIQTRMSSVSMALSFVKILPKVRIIYDSRGASLEELHYNIGNKKISLLKRIRHLFSVKYEKKILDIADKVFCVSEKLKSYHLSKNKILQKDKFLIIPGAADPTLFLYNKTLRNNIREKLKINDKIVLVYSGRLAMKWEIPEKIFQLYKCLEDKITNVTLLLLTPDIDIAKSLKKLNNFSNDQIIIHKSKYKNVCDYLNAADFALLLRDDVPMNNVASPTKFSEYMLCGLPVIISNGIGDFSQFIDKNSFGFVINSLLNLKDEMKELAQYIQEISKDSEKQDSLRQEIASLGKEKLSKEIFLSKIIETIITI